MPYDPRNFYRLMFYTICLILISSYLFANENGDLSKEIYPVEDVKVIEILEKIDLDNMSNIKIIIDSISESISSNT